MAVELKGEWNENAADLKAKLADHSARVAVVGAGYVGLPLGVEKAKVGFNVMLVDRNEKRVDQVNAGENYILDVKDVELRQVVADRRLWATTDFTLLRTADVIVICVPTPLTINREPDLQYIVAVTEEIARNLRPGQLISLESTTYPGTTEEVIRPRLEATGLEVGKDIFLAFSPERVDPGNARYTTKNTNKLVGGVTPTCTEVATAFYSQTILTVIPVSSPSVAEMAKVFENTYRAVNIALVNEMALLCDRMGLNVWEVLDASFTKPFGIQPFYPGPGVGGHCIPIDPFYLTWKAREYDFSTRFIELAGETNLRMPYFVVEKAMRILGLQHKALRDSNVLVLGVTYKRDLPDERESPAEKVVQLLLKEGAQVSYHDPYVAQLRVQPLQHDARKDHVVLSCVPLNDATLRAADLVIITTDHSSVDYAEVANRARAVLDTRGVTRRINAPVGRVWVL